MDAKCDFSTLKNLTERLEQAPKVLKEAKRQAFEAAAPKLKAAVQREIGGSGRVRNWQEIKPVRLSKVTVNGLPDTSVVYISSSSARRASRPAISPSR